MYVGFVISMLLQAIKALNNRGGDNCRFDCVVIVGVFSTGYLLQSDNIDPVTCVDLICDQETLLD